MTQDPRSPGGRLPDEDAELTEPIAELADFSEPTSAGFLDRLKRRIERRIFASEVVDFSWASPGQILMQFLDMLFSGFGAGRNKGER